MVTAGLTVVGLLGGFGCGLLVALLRSTPNPVVQRHLARGYIWFFRGTPLLIQLVIVYSGLPQIGIRFVVPTAVMALTLNEMAYLAEIIRGGFMRSGGTARRRHRARPVAVAGDQEGSAAAGGAGHHSGARQFRERPVQGDIDHLGDLDGGIDAAHEMVMQVKFDVLEVFGTAAVLYLVLTTVWDQIQRRLERRFNRADRAKTATTAPAVEQAVEQAALQR